MRMRSMVFSAAAACLFAACGTGGGEPLDVRTDQELPVDAPADELSPGDPDAEPDISPDGADAEDLAPDDPAPDDAREDEPEGDGTDIVPDVPDADLADDAGPLPGDDCSAPLDVVLTGSTASIDGSTAGMHHDYDGPPACSIPSSSLDVVYKASVPAGQQIAVHYTADGVMDCISVQRACPDTTLIGGCTCGDPTTTLDAVREYAESGDAYIFIWGDGEKDFHLDVELSAI
jgi:hypothetical protein